MVGRRGIKRGDIVHLINSEPKEIETGCLVLDTADGVARVACDRIIARIGALPPRRFVESCGVAFPNDSPTAYPPVSETYESGVPGLYVVGALAEAAAQLGVSSDTVRRKDWESPYRLVKSQLSHAHRQHLRRT